DVVAGKIGEALHAEKLILLTDVEGVKGRDGALVEQLSADEARDLVADGTIAAGMIPKIECCIDALAGGVRQTHIIDGRGRHALLLEARTTRGAGTEVVRGRGPKARSRRLVRA